MGVHKVQWLAHKSSVLTTFWPSLSCEKLIDG